LSADVTGTGFYAGYPVTSFTFNGQTPNTQTCTSQTTGLFTGVFNCNFTVPNLAAGEYEVEATVNGMTAFGSFTIATTTFDLEFAETGLDSSAVGSVVTFSTGEFTPVTFSQLPKDEGTVNSGVKITYSFASTLPSSNSGEQFVLTSPAPSPSSGFAISAATTVTGTYQKQHYVQFAASPNNGGTTTANEWYNDGSSGNSVAAVASAGYSFVNWTVQCVSGSSCITFDTSASITVNGPATLVANFVPTAPTSHPTSTSISCFGASVTTDYVGGLASCEAIVTDTGGSGATSPSGTVTFSSDASSTFGPFGSLSGEFVSPSSCTLATLTSTESSCTVGYTPNSGSEGLNSLTAACGGDGSHYRSESTFQLEVYDRQTSTSVTCASPSGGSEICTAKVMDLSTYDEQTPTGQVFFLTSGGGSFVAASGSTFSTGIEGLFNGCTLNALPLGGAPNTLWASCSVTYNLGSSDQSSFFETAVVYTGDSLHLDSNGYTQALDADQPLTVSSYVTYAGNTPLTLKWLVSVDGGAFGDASALCGAPTNTNNQGFFDSCAIPGGALTAGDTYSFELQWTDSNSMTFTDLLPTSTVTIYPALQVTLSPRTQTVDRGQTATISDSTATTGTPSISFQWIEQAPGALSYTPAIDCSDPTIDVCNFATTLGTQTGTYNFELEVTDSVPIPETQVSSPSSVTVNPALTAGSITPSGVTMDSGQSISLSASWSGGSSTYAVSWYSGSSATCASDTTLVSTDSGLSTSPDSKSITHTSSTFYCAVITDFASGAPTQSATDAAILISVNSALVAGTITPASPSINLGQSTTLTANPSGGTSPYGISWYSGTSLACSSDTTPSGAGSSIVVSPTSSTYYCYTATDSSGGSPAASTTSATDLVTVNAPLKAPVIRVSRSIVKMGSSANLAVSTAFTSGTPTYSCEWLIEPPGAASFSVLLPPGAFSCSAGAIFSTSTDHLNNGGIWSLKLQVSDSAGES